MELFKRGSVIMARLHDIFCDEACDVKAVFIKMGKRLEICIFNICAFFLPQNLKINLFLMILSFGRDRHSFL